MDVNKTFINQLRTRFNLINSRDQDDQMSSSSNYESSEHVALQIKDEPLEEEVIGIPMSPGAESFEPSGSKNEETGYQEEAQELHDSFEDQALILEEIEDIFMTVGHGKSKKRRKIDPLDDDSASHNSEDSDATVIANNEFEDEVVDVVEFIEPQGVNELYDDEKLPTLSELLRQMKPCQVVLDKNEVSKYLANRPKKPAHSAKRRILTQSISKPKPSRRPMCHLCKTTFAHLTSLRRHKARIHHTEPTCQYCKGFYLYLEEHKKVCKMRQAKESQEKQDSMALLESLLRNKVPQMATNGHDSDIEVVEDVTAPQKSTPSVSKSIQVKTNLLPKKNTTCHICNKMFVTINSFRSHMNMVHGSEPQCPKCNRYFMDFVFLNQHVKTCTVQKKKIRTQPKSSADSQLNDLMAIAKTCRDRKVLCPICKIRVKHKWVLRNHLVNVHNLKPYCKKCKHIFDTKLELESHKCKCDLCGLSVVNVKLHNALKHYTEPVCHWCHTFLASTEKLEEHLESCIKHTNNVELLDCKKCGQSFLAGYLLRLHMARQHYAEPLCKICNSIYKSTYELNLHIKVVHNNAKCSEVNGSNTRGDIHKNQSHSTNKVLNNHSKQTNSSPVAKIDGKTVSENINKSPAVIKKPKSTPMLKKNFDNCCPKCETCFKSGLMLDMHMKVYHNMKSKPLKVPSVCKRCGKRCSTSFNLTQHMAGKHGILPKCNKCGKTFKVFLYYKHIKNCTSPSLVNTPTHQENQVGPVFIMNNTPVIKIEKVEEPSPPTSSLPTSSLPTSQLATSSKQCNICFKQVKYMRKHKAGVHKTEPLCSKCGKFFSTYDSLDQHLEQCLTALGKERRKKRLQKQGLDYGFVLMDPGNNSEENECNSESSSVINERLDCEFCHLTYKSRKTLKYHMKNLHQTYINFCPHCQDKFLDKLKFDEHVNNCDKSHLQLNRSDTSAHNFESDGMPVFEEVRVSEQNLHLIKVESEETPNDIVPLQFLELGAELCQDCNQSFSSEIELKNHINSEHNGTYLLCYPCRLELKSIPEFVAHIHSCKKSKNIVESAENNKNVQQECEADIFESETTSETFIVPTSQSEVNPDFLEPHSDLLSETSENVVSPIFENISDQTVVHVKTEPDKQTQSSDMGEFNTNVFEPESNSENIIVASSEIDSQILIPQSELLLESEDTSAEIVPIFQNVVHIKSENFESL